jgi:glutamyl-tRNA reductase
MHYLTISFTHKNTDISIREKLAFNDEEKLKDFCKKLIVNKNINEVIVLSTCNRVEIISSVKSCTDAIENIFKDLSTYTGFSKEELEGRADTYEDTGAIHHLFAVASSLDSLVIGETQIVGQIKDAFRFSYEIGCCGQKLARAMHYAFRCAAVVRNSTDISKNPVSISSVAVSKAKEIFGGNLGGYSALIVGAGEMSSLAAKHLANAGVNIIIFNRNIQKAKNLASEIGGTAKVEPFSNLKEYINKFRLLFSATTSAVPIITKDMVKKTDFDRHWFDMAVPRDIQECEFDNVNIYAVDDLESIVSSNMAFRQEQAKIAYSIIGKFTMEFYKWLQTLSVDPIIKQIREIAKECSLKEIERAIKKGYLPKEHQAQVTKIVHQAFNTFLHKPTKNLKKIAESPEADTVVQSIQYFFDLNSTEAKHMNRYKCEYQIEKDLK